MQILKMDMKNRVVKLRVQNPDDLWHLEKILEPGDLVTSRTMRKTTIKRGEEIGHGERKAITLTINLEKKEYHKDLHKLRLTGKILSGPEDMVTISSYHTLSIDTDSVLSVKKPKWKSHQIERVKKAKVQRPLLFICVIDREEADFARLKESGVEMAGSVHAKKVKDQEDRGSYYEEVMKVLDSQEGFQTIVIAGPGFERENLLAFIQKRKPELAKKIILEHAYGTGRAGIQEILKKSAQHILKETRIAQETELVEKLLEGIGRDGLVVYGRDETVKALKIGALETLLVSEEKIQDFEEIMDLAEKKRAKIVIISPEHESGEKFLSLGGIAGFLRFRV